MAAEGPGELAGEITLLLAAVKRESRAAWLARCREAGIPAGPVAGVLEALGSPQAQALGSVLVTERDGRKVPTVRPPFFLEGFSDPPSLAPPRLGEDTERLFAEVGLVAPR